MRSLIPFAVSVASCNVVGCVVTDDDSVDTLVTMKGNYFDLANVHKHKMNKCYYYSDMKKSLTKFTVVSSVTNTTCAEVAISYIISVNTT